MRVWMGCKTRPTRNLIPPVVKAPEFEGKGADHERLKGKGTVVKRTRAMLAMEVCWYGEALEKRTT